MCWFILLCCRKLKKQLKANKVEIFHQLEQIDMDVAHQEALEAARVEDVS